MCWGFVAGWLPPPSDQSALAYLTTPAETTYAAFSTVMAIAVVTVLAAWGWVNNFKLNEVADYHLLLNLNPGTYSTVMNKDTWDRLDPEVQAHLKDWLPVYFFYNTTDSAAAATRDVPEENIFTLSAEDQAALSDAMQPQYQEWVGKADAEGWDGQALLDETARLMTLYSRN